MPETNSPDPAILVIGDVTLDLATAELEREGARSRLQDKPFQVLRMLAEQPGELVTREQLSARLWPEGTYVEFEMGLNTAVRKLRTALGDEADAPRYIETLPRRGYRLIAPVQRPGIAVELAVPQDASDPLEESALPPTVSAEPRAVDRNTITTSRRWWVPAAAGLVALVIVLVAAGFWFSSHRTASLAGSQSIAVLPFLDLSELKDQEYFSDGLSEQLIESLGRTQGLRVIARTSSFYFKGRAEKLETIATELQVAHILEGSVRKSGDRVRVTAQLIRVDTGEHLWSQTFDRRLDDVFEVQDEIAGAVVTALKGRLLQAPPAGTELHTANLDAYNFYLQGRQAYNQGDAAGFQRAVTAFRAAVNLDPRYAAAYADLALAQFWLADNTADTEGYKSALAAAEQAVTLDPKLAAGYSARGFLRAVYLFDFAAARTDMDRAVTFSPQDALVLHRSAILLGILGNVPEAIAREEQALALDPLSEEICRRLGFFFAANRQFEQARSFYVKALAIAPGSDRARFSLGNLELLTQHPEQARVTFNQIAIEAFRLEGIVKTEFSLGHAEESRRLLEQLVARFGGTSAAQIIDVYAWRGEKDRAFEWAERAYQQRDTGLTWLKIDPEFGSLREDSRYAALLRKMNLPN